jgi:hypothetical protein
MPDSLVRISVIQQLERLLHGKLRPLMQQGCHLSYLQFACRKHINRPFSIKWTLLTSIHNAQLQQAILPLHSYHHSALLILQYEDT